MSKRQYTTPVVVKDGKAIALSPIPPGEGLHHEDWFQELLFSCPTLLPINDIEPGFGQLIPIARELPTARGPLDLFFVDPDGQLILIETKLWRNPEARRKVVGQIVDYATAISKWSYNDLVASVKAATGSSADDALMHLIREKAGPDLDESRFIDAVSLNLSRGRFLLLIVGDGIHEGVEQMVEFLDRYPQLGFRLGLVEIGLYRLGDSGDLFVQPRVTAATREVVRAVVHISSGVNAKSVTVEPPPVISAGSGRGPLYERSSLSEESFFTSLREIKPELASLAAEVICEAPAHGLKVEWKRNGAILKYFHDGGEDFNFGQLSPDGTLAYSGWLSTKSKRLDLSDQVWRGYYERVLPLLAGARIQEREERGVPGKNWCFTDSQGDDPKVEPLLRHKDEWFSAIEATIALLKPELEKQGV